MLHQGDGVQQDLPRAMAYLEKATGHPQAQYLLATMLNKDPEQQTRAFGLFVEAAKSGLDRAQFNAGYCYFMGKGVGQDFAKAAEYFQLAAEQGFVYAQVNLGNMLSEGRGVARDLERAKRYFRMAAPFNAHAKVTLQEIEEEEGKEGKGRKQE